MKQVVTTKDLIAMKEFKVVAKKLGIDLDLAIKDITIYIPANDIIDISISFYGTDKDSTNE